MDLKAQYQLQLVALGPSLISISGLDDGCNAADIEGNCHIKVRKIVRWLKECMPVQEIRVEPSGAVDLQLQIDGPVQEQEQVGRIGV